MQLLLFSADGEAEIIPLVSGKQLLMYDEFTFSRPKSLRKGDSHLTSWLCTDRGANRCKKYIHVDDHLRILASFNFHNHFPPKYMRTKTGQYIRLSGIPYEFIPSIRGKRNLILLNDYTFCQINKDMRYWYCTEKLNKKCPAKLHLDDNRLVVRSSLDHNHDAPKYYRTSNVTVVTLSTGSTFLIINGHTFRKEEHGNGATSRWCCNEPAQGKCDVYAHVNEKFELVLIVNKHNHEPILCRMLQDMEQFLDEDYINEENGDDEDVVIFLESKNKRTILQYGGYRYRKAYKTKNGTRWACSTNRSCPGFIYLNDSDEIIMNSRVHNHRAPNDHVDILEPRPDTAVVITSRKGKEMLLFRKFTYRKQYEKGKKSRWVCSTMKNCRASVFTNANNIITSAFEEHNHGPPKYYLNPNHVLQAIREPLVFESD